MKDADIPESAFPDLYVELLLMTRKMFIECKLVHADLSEYNILYHIDDTSPDPAANRASAESAGAAPENEETEEQPGPPAPRGHLWIIDVSQSVEHDHPHAFDFLRADLRNVEDFFAKRGVPTVGLRRTFEFVTRDRLADGQSAEAVLREWMANPEVDGQGEGGGGEKPTDGAHEDEVFMRSYIPRTLNEVYDPERDVDVLARGEGENLIYRDTIGIVAPGQRDRENGAAAEDAAGGAAKGEAKQQKKAVSFADGKEHSSTEGEEEEAVDGEDESESEDDEEGEEGRKERKPRGHRHEDKQAKKVSTSVCDCRRRAEADRAHSPGAQEGDEGGGAGKAQAQNSESGEET